MTYSQRPAAVSRFDFDTVAAIAATQRRAERKKLARLRTAKRVLHFIGFICYWATAYAALFLAMLATMIVCFWLS
jgi:hypothetical protein